MGMAASTGKRFALLGAVALAAAMSSGRSVAQESYAALKQANEAYRAGQAALAHRDLAAAEKDFAEVVRLAPQAEQGHSALGAVLVSRGQIRQGIGELQRALAMKPDDSTAQLNLALAYVQTGSPQRALPLFSKIESHARAQGQHLPSYVLVQYARSLLQAHEPVLAAAKLKEAVAIDPQNAELHDELGSIYAQQLSWANAQREFATAVRLNPRFAVAYMHLGLAMRAQGEAGGTQEIAHASQLAPGNPMIALELGQAYVAEGNDAQAIPVFRHVLAITPHSMDAAYQLALALQRTNDAGDAIPLLKKVVAAQPKNVAALTNLGMALCQAQNAKDAVPVLQRAVSLAPGNVTARENLAAAYVQLSQFDGAISDLRAAIKLAPGDPQLHYDLGLAYKWQDKADEAIPELETAEHLNPNAPEAPYLLGLLYLQEGHYRDAAREMSLALKLRPNDSDGWATLGSVYENLNELPQAESALKEAIQQAPNQADAYLTLASVLVKQNKLQEAREDREKAANLMRAHMNFQRAQVSTHAGEAMLKAGEVANAVLEFKDALSFEPNYAPAHLGLAKALDRQGKTMEAAAEREKARSGGTGASSSAR
jgi:protein O-GlcNAc transferase